jgi:hypothetical protein
MKTVFMKLLIRKTLIFCATNRLIKNSMNCQACLQSMHLVCYESVVINESRYAIYAEETFLFAITVFLVVRNFQWSQF